MPQFIDQNSRGNQALGLTKNKKSKVINLAENLFDDFDAERAKQLSKVIDQYREFLGEPDNASLRADRN